MFAILLTRVDTACILQHPPGVPPLTAGSVGMRLDLVTPAQIHIVLSRRNLLTLLAKLEGHPPLSACTISFPGAGEEPALVVSAESDDLRYGRRSAPAGAMHPDTEAWVAHVATKAAPPSTS